MSIESIELRNFTVFDNLKINFLKGINVIMGENGIGKTQLLKAIYADIQISKSKNIDDISKNFKSVNINNVFFTKQLKPLFLEVKISNSKNSSGKEYLMGKLNLNSNGVNLTSESDDECSYEISYPEQEMSCTFIPAKDILLRNENEMNFIEAKSSLPRPTKENNMRFNEFIDEISHKFIHSFNLLYSTLLKRNKDYGELNNNFFELDNSKLKLKFILVIKGHDIEWLLPISEVLKRKLLYQNTIWKSEVVVMNDKIANKYNLVKGTN